LINERPEGAEDRAPKDKHREPQKPKRTKTYNSITMAVVT
jgi:hypothetical protein